MGEASHSAETCQRSLRAQHCTSPPANSATGRLDRARGFRQIRRMNKHTSALRVALALAAIWLHLPASPAAAADADSWKSLFNGKDLTGWTPKFKGYKLGENYANTFRVEGGALRVVYEDYTEFNDKYGHLFYETPFSNYVLRVEYRFVGEQTKGGAGWAFRNSGAMLHCQPPATMGRDQSFPVSIEVQFLGGDGRAPRPTANLCTPGTHVVLNGKLHTPHCTNSRSKTYHGDEWVTVEIEVHGNRRFIHRIGGETVLEYESPQLDPGDADAQKLIQGADRMLYGGYIALQAESHPVEFRKVEIRLLDD